MSRVQIPLTAVEVGGNLNAWYYNNCVLRSDVTKSTDDDNANASDNFNLSLSEVANILAESGEVYEYLMAVKAPIAILDADVPNDLPNNKTMDGTASEVAKQFKNWLVPNAEIWKKDDDTEILFYTNPFAGNSSSYLTGSEIAIINNISAAVEILTVASAEIETATGWTKL